MNGKELLRRYVIFFFGLVFSSFGVAFTTKAGLGTSPVSAIPYSVSLVLPVLTFGQWLIVLCLIQVAVQIILLRRQAKPVEMILQVILAFGFGYFTDLSMLCLAGFQPEGYLWKVLSLLVGCVIMAFGIYLELIADVVMLSGDAFIRAIAQVTGKEYGGVKVASDVIMAATGAIICLVFLGNLAGVREGTVMAALIVGNIIKFYKTRLRRMEWTLLPENRARMTQVREEAQEAGKGAGREAIH